MPRKNSKTWNIGDAITSARLNSINSDVDDIYANWNDRMKLFQNPGDGLTVRIGAGNWRVGDNQGIAGWGPFTVPNNATTYVMLDANWSLQYSQSGWVSAHARVGRVVASGWTCTIVNEVPDLVGWLLSGKGITQVTTPIPNPSWYPNNTMIWPEFRSQSGNGWSLNIPGEDGVTLFWFLTTYVGADAWYYRTQIAMSSDNNYNDACGPRIYMRRGVDWNIWGQWKRVSAPANFLTFNSTVQAGGAQSVYLQYGGFVDADYSFSSYASNTLGIYLQISSDNSNWTTIAKKELRFHMGYMENYVSSISLSWFVPQGKYVRVITQNLSDPYSVAKNLLASVSIWPFNI